MDIQLITADSRMLLRKIKSLYRRSFPRFERKPFAVIIKNREKGIARIYAIVDEKGVFCGLAIFAEHNDLELLDYFAVCSKMRGKGIGSASLKKIEELFKDKRLFLEIERVDGKNDRKGIKSRRKSFYLHCGMTETGLFVKVFGVDMEILSYGCSISFEEYFGLYRYMIGERCSENIREVKNA